MKVVLAGAYGNLGSDIFKALVKAGHEVVAADMMERDLGITGNFSIGESIAAGIDIKSSAIDKRHLLIYHRINNFKSDRFAAAAVDTAGNGFAGNYNRILLSPRHGIDRLTDGIVYL